MSLVKDLTDLVGRKGYLSYEELKRYSDLWQFKLSTGERRLRESPEIEPVFKQKSLFNKKRYIVGYKLANG